MSPARAERLQRTLAAASALRPEARAAYLDAACGDDAALRREVESLLRSFDRAGRFLAAPSVHEIVGPQRYGPDAGPPSLGADTDSQS